MSRLDASGVLNDYSVAAQERMAFDRARAAAPVLAVDAELAADTSLVAALQGFDPEAELTTLERLVAGYGRLP